MKTDIAISAFTICLLLSSYSFAQKDYSIGDKIKRKEPVNIRSTVPIRGPFVTFIEKKFTLEVSKADVLNVIQELNNYLLDKDDIETLQRIKTINNYLDTCTNLTFQYIWTGKDVDYASLSADSKIRLLAVNYLRDAVCSIAENHKLRIKRNGTSESEFYISGVPTIYGYAQGICTRDDRLIWICPPITID